VFVLVEHCFWYHPHVMIAYQQTTRIALPGWESLLLIYGAIFIPVALALLVGVNLWVWSKSRINYAFILGLLFDMDYPPLVNLSFAELDSRTKLDWQEYFEVRFIAALCDSHS
jgi:xenotropic and polytropic retrovirus receptor 1